MDSLAWCRDRVLVPGNPLTASLLFADPAQRDRILVLRTLIAELAAVVESSEDRVIETKLQWWRDALAGAHEAARRHPLMQALEITGVLEQFDDRAFDPLMEAISTLAEKPRFERLSEVWQLADSIGGEATSLEGQLLGGTHQLQTTLKKVGGAAYLVRMTRDIALDARANRWWVPLELQADFQVSRADVAEAKTSRGFDGLIRSLISDAIKRAHSSTAGLDRDDAWRHRHALIHWGLDRRLGLKIARKPARLLEKRLLLPHAVNVWASWRCARQLQGLPKV